MDSVIDPVSGDPYNSADYETLEARAMALRIASASSAAAGSDDGGDGVSWWKSTGIPTGDLVTIDDNHDWRNRVVEVLYVDLTTADNRPRGSTDYTDWGTLTQVRMVGWLGGGAYSNVAGAGTAVSAGNPPLAATGGVTSYRLTLVASVYLYADPTTGALKAYNALGADHHAALVIRATGTIAA